MRIERSVAPNLIGVNHAFDVMDTTPPLIHTIFVTLGRVKTIFSVMAQRLLDSQQHVYRYPNQRADKIGGEVVGGTM